jgi:hypothetical protein
VKVYARFVSLFINALSQSMPVDQMQRVTRRVIPNYDIYERSGFPSAIPIPRADAARHILKDLTSEGLLIKYIEALIDITSNGSMGRDVRIALLPRIIAEIEEQGFHYSPEKGIFVEAESGKRTMGWGTLAEGRTYEFALLRIDIVGNTELVRRYTHEQVSAAYATVRDLVTRLVEKREGRIWSWEGDGALAAFYFLDKTIQATLCGMEITHDLFMYNLLGRALPEPILARLAVHAGPCRFMRSAKESGGDTIRRVELQESQYTTPGCLTVSPGIFTDLGSKLSPLFLPIPGPENGSVYRYSLECEKK